MDIQWIIYSPIVITIICLIFYLVNSLIRPSLKAKDFIGFLLIGGTLGFGISIIIVIAQTYYYQSPQGPLALIYYAPAGIAAGEVFGVLIWLYYTLVKNQHSKNTGNN